MANPQTIDITFEKRDSMILGHFRAMANPCTIIIEHDDRAAAQHAIRLMAEEAWRIEHKYSRYDPHSQLSAINDSDGHPVGIDNETHQLLNLAAILWEESEGVFDITSGIFRTIWTFDPSQQIPTQKEIDSVLKRVDWQKLQFNENQITIPSGMQIDFGGIGKEYAADRCAALAPEELGTQILVNLGGDIVAKGPRRDGSAWKVGIQHKYGGNAIWKTIPLKGGAIATSGDVYKSVVIDGQRYGHIINALSGYPVLNPPSTITVAAPNCTEAGMLSTLAILQGPNAEQFLKSQNRPYWIQY